MRVTYERKFHPQQNKQVSYAACEDIKFKRVHGGLQWPGIDTPGFALVVTEDVNEDESIGLKHLRVIGEFEDQRIEALLSWCEMREIDMPPQAHLEWYADIANRPQMEPIWRFRDAMRKGGRYNMLELSPPPYLDFRREDRDASYIQNLNRYLRWGALHMPEDSRLRGDLVNLETKMSNPVLALAYVVSGLGTWPDAGRVME